MKLTWFGGRTIRVHIGGAILVGEPEGAPAGVDRGELVSGADRVFAFGQGAEVDPGQWKPRRAPTALADDGTLAEVLVWQIGDGAVLVDAVGEPPLVLSSSLVPTLGRWAAQAVVVLFGDAGALADNGAALLETAAPRLLVLGGPETAIDAAVSALRDRLDGTGLMALEPGMALEV